MAADPWKVYNKFKQYLGDGTIDLDSHTFKMALFLSTSNCATLTLDKLADLTNEHAAANGYVTGGVTLAAVTWVEAAGVVTFDCANLAPGWTGSGGPIQARYAVIYDDTPTTPVDPLVAYCLLDNTPADVVVSDAGNFNVTIHANGVFQQSGGS